MAVRPPVVRIVRLDYERTVPVGERRPIRVYVHNDTELFPVSVEMRPILYELRAGRWMAIGYGSVMGGIPRCSNASWEFGAYSNVEGTITYKVDVMVRRPPYPTEWVLGDSTTFSITYSAVAPPRRPWWLPPWLPWP